MLESELLEVSDSQTANHSPYMSCHIQYQSQTLFLGLLYAVGGYDGATRQCLSTVEAYNPNTNEWTYTSEMGTRRSGAGNTHRHILILTHVVISVSVNRTCALLQV